MSKYAHLCALVTALSLASAEAWAQGSCAAIAFSMNGAWASQTWEGDDACRNARIAATLACRRNGGHNCGFATLSSACVAVAICNHWNGQRIANAEYGMTEFVASENAMNAVLMRGWSGCYVRVSWCPYGPAPHEETVE